MLCLVLALATCTNGAGVRTGSQQSQTGPGWPQAPCSAKGNTIEMDPKTQLIGLLGLSILGIVTAIEAGQTVKKVRQAGSQA
jgi:hypothetical protein